MDENIGILLLDDTEIIIRFYANMDNHWVVLHAQTRDLASFHPTHPLDPTDVIAAVAEASLVGYKFHVTEWKMYTRNVPDKIIQELNHITGFTFEELTLSEEQNLIVQGILWQANQEYTAPSH
jgi:hypothetical protein